MKNFFLDINESIFKNKGLGFGIIVTFLINWKLAFVMLCFVPVTFISGVISGNASLNAKTNGKYLNEEGGSLGIETIENIKTLASLGREKYFANKFNKIYKIKFKRTLLILHVASFFYSL